MKEVKFYICPVCGNVIEVLNGNINNVSCCGKKLVELIAGTTDASLEKHVPVYEKKEDNIIVNVGSLEHPMESDHYIMWIALVKDNLVIRKNLIVGSKTKTEFPYIKNSTIYAYCNKHGLFKNDVI